MKSRGAWLAVATSLAAVLACGGGNNGSNNGANGNGSGSGGFPFSGPSCNSSTIGGCFGCLESSCNGGCLTSACSDFFGCFCNCAQGDNSCYQSCSGSISASCEQCVTSVASCAEGSCASACGAAGSSGVGPPGGSGSSGGSSSGSSGGGMFQSCGGNGVVCADGSQMEFCQTGFQNMCTSAFYQVGLQTFPCASCTDVTACLQEAQNACGPSVVDAGPPPFDVGPVPDAPFLDGGSQVCTPHACGTMGQSMLFCEDFDANNTCTFAWFESGGQTFDCNSCSDCTTAAQEASKACP